MHVADAPLQEFFGCLWRDDESGKFTTDLEALDISFRNDLVTHPEFPMLLRHSGYPVEDGTAGWPGFRAPERGDFRFREDEEALGRDLEGQALALVDGGIWNLPDRLDLAAFEEEMLIEPHPTGDVDTPRQARLPPSLTG